MNRYLVVQFSAANNNNTTLLQKTQIRYKVVSISQTGIPCPVCTLVLRPSHTFILLKKTNHSLGNGNEMIIL